MPSDSKNYSDLISRRRFVELAGVSGAAALAGCDGGDGDTPTEEPGTDPADPGTDGDGMNVVDTTFTNMSNGVPTELHVNQLNQQNYEWDVAWLMHERLAAWNFADGEFKMGGLESWEFTEDTITLNIREDLSWDDGDDYTADDLATHWELLMLTESPASDFTDSFEAVDDKTFEISLAESSHPRITKFTLANIRMFVKQDIFEEYVDQDASEIRTFQWQGADDVVSTGPWSLTDVTDQAWTLERNPDYWNAENINWSTWETIRRDSNTAQQQALINGQESDAATSLFCPPRVVARYPDHVEEVNLPAKWGYGTIFNHEDEHFGDRAVRQACAYVINRQQIVQNAGPNTKFISPRLCGIAPRDQENWIGDVMDSFTHYGGESTMTDEASSVLEDAGYSQTDGTWEDSSGNAISADYLTPGGWTDFTAATQTIVDQLNNFGFDVSVASVPNSDRNTRYTEGNFKLGARSWLPGGARSSFPYFPLRYQAGQAGVSNGHGYPMDSEVTVPGMDGGELSIVPFERAQEIATTADDEEAKPIVQEVAYHNNQDLPLLSLVSKYEQSWLTDDEWDVAGPDHPSRQVKWPPLWMPRQGQLQAQE